MSPLNDFSETGFAVIAFTQGNRRPDARNRASAGLCSAFAPNG
jgi:hypothetical protein